MYIWFILSLFSLFFFPPLSPVNQTPLSSCGQSLGGGGASRRPSIVEMMSGDALKGTCSREILVYGNFTSGKCQIVYLNPQFESYLMMMMHDWLKSILT